MKKTRTPRRTTKKLRLHRETLRWLTLGQVRGGEGEMAAAIDGFVTHTCCPCDTQATCVEMTCEMC